VPASSRLEHSTIPYALVDGTIIADDWDVLTSGVITAPMNKSETYQIINAAVWTNTTQTGFPSFTTPGLDCADWQSIDRVVGSYGISSTTTINWTATDLDLCDVRKHLYCIE
jgi:hypothetical protein